MISVIIPNYNHQEFLEKRIHSVLNQSYQDIEVLLLDDCSTDNSQNILKQYENHPKVSQIIYNSENSGSVFKQWIKGIQLAKGDYVWIAESDDYADVKFLETTVTLLETNHKLGLVFTDSFKVDGLGNILGLVSKSKKALNNLASNGQNINKTNCAKYLLEQLVIVNGSSVLFRKSSLINVDFEVLKNLKNVGDAFVYVGVALKSDAYFLPEPLNFMRLHTKNTTKINKKNGLIYKDKILLLDYYLTDFIKIKNARKPIIGYFVGLFFLSIDFGHIQLLKRLLDNMLKTGFLKNKSLLKIKMITFLYRYLMPNGRPFMLREYLKQKLKQAF